MISEQEKIAKMFKPIQEIKSTSKNTQNHNKEESSSINEI